MSVVATLSGCGTALVTPFTASGTIDEPALRALVTAQLAAGIDFLVPCGSTGEAATLSVDEHVRVVALVVEVVNGRVPVIAGAGSNDTAKAVAMTRAVANAGATHVLHVSPMYNKPPQRGIIAHFTTIADASPVPVMLYNVPSRTGSNMEADTTLTLAEHEQIVAMKEASGNLAQIDVLLRDRPAGFAVFSGDDAFTLPMMALGADGVVSVVSNVFPVGMVQLAAAMRVGNIVRGRALHQAMLPFFSAAFIESNPMPAKAVLAARGVMQNVVRLPLVPLAQSHTPTLQRAVADVHDALALLGVAS